MKCSIEKAAIYIDWCIRLVSLVQVLIKTSIHVHHVVLHSQTPQTCSKLSILQPSCNLSTSYNHWSENR